MTTRSPPVGDPTVTGNFITVELVPGDSSGYSEWNDLYWLLRVAQESVALESRQALLAFKHNTTSAISSMAPRARLPLSEESSAWADLSSRADPASAACFSRVRGMHVVRAMSHDHDSRFARAAGSETETSIVGHVPRLSLSLRTLVASRPSPTLVAPQILRPKTQASSADAATARCPAKACRST